MISVSSSHNRPATLFDALPPHDWLLLLCCTALTTTLVLLTGTLLPRVTTWPLPALCLAVTFESLLSGAFIHRRRLERERLTAYRLQELAALFLCLLLVLTALRLLTGGGNAGSALFQAFLANPLALIDQTALAWLVLLVVAWYLPTWPQRLWWQLDPQVGELGPLPQEPGYDDWLHSPARHFDHQQPFRRLLRFYVAALTLQGIIASLVWDRQAWVGVGIAVVACAGVYCLGGLMLLTMANHRLRTTRWQVERIEVHAGSAANWARLNGTLIAVLLVVAAVFPAAILLTTVRFLLGALLALLAGLLSFLAVPVPHQLTSRLPPPHALPAPRLPPVASAAAQHGFKLTLPSWLPSLLVGLAVMGVAVWLLNRARPLLRSRGTFAASLLASAAAIWRTVRGWLGRWGGRARRMVDRVAAALQRRPGDRRGAAHGARSSLGKATERALVRRLFQALVREGSRAGVDRPPGQTAREYAARLARELPDADESLQELARTFDRAAYSPAPVTRGGVGRARQLFVAARDAVRAWARQRAASSRQP